MEQFGVQKAGKSLTQSSRVREPMIMTDGLAGRFPDVFLRIELRTGGWERQQLQAGIVHEKLTDGIPTMTGRRV